MLDYLDSFQNFLSVYVVAAIGYLCSSLKMFDSKQISAIRRVLYLTAIPGMMFYQIGKTKPTKDTWAPLLISFLVQVSIHLVLFIVCYVFPFTNRRLQFFKSIFAVTHINFLMFGTSLAQYLWEPNNYISVAVICAICDFFLITPIHSFLVYHPPVEGADQSSESLDEKDTKELEEVNEKENNDKEEEEAVEGTTEIDVPGSLNQKEKKTNSQATLADQVDKMTGQPFAEIDGDGKDLSTPENSQEHPISLDSKIDTQFSHSEESKDIPEVETNSVGKRCCKKNAYVPNERLEEAKNSHYTYEPSLKRTILFSFANAINICTVIGIIWSFCPWGMFKLIDEFAGDLSKAVAGIGLFCTGCFMRDHPFSGCNWAELVIYLVIHFFGLPFLALLFCWILKLDKGISQAVILMHAMPCGLTGYVLTSSSGQGMQAASFTWFYSNLLSLPMQMVWTAILNNLKFLN